jgi:hypothetical protein
VNWKQLTEFRTIARNTHLSGVAGTPSLTIPAGLSSFGVPVGRSFEGPIADDSRLLGLGLSSKLRGPLARPRIACSYFVLPFIITVAFGAGDASLLHPNAAAALGTPGLAALLGAQIFPIYSRYSRASRLAMRAPRRPHTVIMKGST